MIDLEALPVSPLDVLLVLVILALLYTLFLAPYVRRWRYGATGSESDAISGKNSNSTPKLPPLKRQDMTVEQLLQYDGSNQDNRICIGVGGKIFDVSKARNLYGKDGPYGIFAGHDASRGLGTFSTTADVVRSTYDDLLDLGPSEMDSIREWTSQLQEKYDVVGRLLKPGEQPDIYTDDEETSSNASDTVAKDKHI